MRKLIFLAICSSFLFNLTYSQTIKRPDAVDLSHKDIDRIVKKLMDTADVPGLCLGIIDNNAPAYVKAYGYKNKAVGTMNDTATCFYSASLAKPLFAYLVMQLVDEVKINLDTPVY